MTLLTQYLITFGWAVTGAISMAIALGLGIKLFSLLTPINEWKEIEKGNLSAALVVSAVILGFALVIGLTIN